MAQYYIGVKHVLAWPETKDGMEGYAVQYPDGYRSWSPQKVFEESYLYIGDERTIGLVSDRAVQDFLDYANVNFKSEKLGDQAAVLNVTTLKTTHRERNILPILDGESFESVSGTTVQAIRQRIRAHLGFVMAWAVNGLTGEACKLGNLKQEDVDISPTEDQEVPVGRASTPDLGQGQEMSAQAQTDSREAAEARQQSNVGTDKPAEDDEAPHDDAV